MSESFQHKPDRVKPPRVQITYDVETAGDVVKTELPFVVGIMADLSGMPDKEQPERPDPATRDGKRLPAEGPKKVLPLRERKYVEIDRDNFNVVMQSIGPRLAFTVGALTAEQAEAGEREEGAGRKMRRIAPKLDENGEQRLMTVALEFKNMDDFSPVQVVRQVEPLRKLLEDRTHLAGLLTKLEGDDKLSHGLPEDILKETDTKKPNQERIAQIDELLTAHLDEIMHDERFKRLEASWRGLHYLVSNTETSTSLKLRLLNAKKEEVLDDLKKAVEFDQSVQFKRLYEDEYGTFGEPPFSVLVADYEFGRHPDDFEFLDKMSGVAAAAHAPFIAAASPKLFDMGSFTELGKPRDLARIFESAELIKWRSFREGEDSRYVALTLPHILMRLPYGPDASPVEEFDYREDVDGRYNSKYLWGNPAYALGARITDAFAKYKWRRYPRRRGRRHRRGAARARLPHRRGRRGAQVPHRDRHHRPPREGAQRPRLHPARPLQEHGQGGLLRRADGAEADGLHLAEGDGHRAPLLPAPLHPGRLTLRPLHQVDHAR